MESAYELFDRIYAEAARASCCVINATLSILRSYTYAAPSIEVPDFMRLHVVTDDAGNALGYALLPEQFGIATACVEAFEDFAAELNAAAAAHKLTKKGGPAVPDRPCEECGDVLCGYYHDRLPFVAGLVGYPGKKKVSA